jgi:aspartyl-tRNA(Asn)/glutamyl-tRNA(Gln) amidotransferase subunit A
VISGKDERDSTSCETVLPERQILNDEKLKIGIPKEYFCEGINPEVKTVIENSIEKLRQAGYSLHEISLPHTEFAIAAYYILTTAEASSNLGRFDSVRYGHRTQKPSSLIDMYERSRTESFGSEVKRRIMLGTYVLSAGYYDAYYKKAQKVRRLIKDDFDGAFKNVDIILTPTSPTTAFKIGEKSASPLSMYLSDIYTISANLAGIPAISIPAGTDLSGLPVGLQFMAPQFGENSLYNVGNFFEN